MSDSVYGSDSDEDMDKKPEYIRELIYLQNNNGVLEFSQKDFPRYLNSWQIFYKRFDFMCYCQDCEPIS